MENNPMPGVPINEEDFPHELQFTANAASWMNLIIEKDPALPFSSAKCEGRSRGSQKRRDLTLIGKDGKVLVTGEVKLPYQKDGSTPHNAAVVSDARKKALRAGADYFFTWNVNECVLWETQTPTDDPAAGQYYKAWKVVSISKGSHLALPSTEDALQDWLGLFVHQLAEIIRGSAKVGFKPPDERFVDALESALSLPIRLTFEELERRYKTPRGRTDLDGWMRDEQGWTLATDEEGIRDNLERAAKFSCYALVNRLVFYEALMKRYGERLPKLNVSEHIDKGDDLRLHLEGFFAQAKEVTGDYETVFGEEHFSIGNRLPFYADRAAPYWRALINQIHEFDFSKLDYEIIGSIFERLISPNERHKYGQFYTRAEVVDLINSFCIRTGEEAVIDPACGGGTFLVRAYARKRELAPGRPHERILAELYGVDISPFACHLTTINLATRNLVEDENYPLIARSDFFDVTAQNRFLSLPSRGRSKGLGKIQHRDIEIPLLDAVIGNPPYVRQEGIRSDKTQGKEKNPLKRGTKEFYRALVKKEADANLSGRSDLHCYFWPHAFTFLKPDGWLCLLTSSQWLDVEYGFRLQDWILSRFKIVAIFESMGEPWFVGARVTTTATLLQRCADTGERARNTVRFVQLRQPVADILSHDGTTAGAVQAADALRDEILSLTENTLTRRYRARLVTQRELLEDGIRLARLMRKSGGDGEEDGDETPQQTTEETYYGGKWGIHLRAPDLWFELMDRFGARFAPLGELAEIRFGVKSGKDEFFFPRDVSRECLDRVRAFHQFRQEFGIDRESVESGEVKLVKCGESYGEIRPIEARYLEPEIHSLMEVKGYTVSPQDCGRMILLVSEPKSELKGTHLLKYIEWGESKGWHKGATCAARVTDTREWYDLTGHRRAAALWPKERQYRHIAPANPESLIANCRLYEVYPSDGNKDPNIWGGILNSSWVLLSSLQYGRPVGNEGNWSTMVVDANLMLVPNPNQVTPRVCKSVAQAFQALKDRPAMQFLSERRMRRMAFANSGRKADLKALSDLSELDMADRCALDNAVLEMLGVKRQRERDDLINELYAYLGDFFEWIRQKEEKAIANKNKAKRKAATLPAELAAQILAEIKDTYGQLLRSYADFLDLNRPFSTFDLPATGVPQVHEDMFAPHGSVRFMKGRKQISIVSTKTPEQAALVVVIATHGRRGLTRVPFDPKDCVSLKKRYETFIDDRSKRFKSMIADRTSDPELQDRIYDALNDLILHETSA
jgi:methylase of polypeptide subunit release factors